MLLGRRPSSGGGGLQKSAGRSRHAGRPSADGIGWPRPRPPSPDASASEARIGRAPLTHDTRYAAHTLRRPDRATTCAGSWLTSCRWP
eukprot:scaffold8514_cov55-Phaeocystis_antarctica.AAC.11